MNKPITVLQREFADRIVQVVNESGLPAFAIKGILTDCLAQITRLEEIQYREDLKAYEEDKGE